MQQSRTSCPERW